MHTHRCERPLLYEQLQQQQQTASRMNSYRQILKIEKLKEIEKGQNREIGGGVSTHSLKELHCAWHFVITLSEDATPKAAWGLAPDINCRLVWF